MKKHNALIILFSISLTLTGCTLPMNESNNQTEVTVQVEHWINNNETRQQLNAGKTGYLPMIEAFQSIASRVHLIRNAKYTLDLQYYIWADDFIGNLMLYEVLKAADRGVKVRLLIDDQNGTKLDTQLKALSIHPNIQIKIYNPYKYRNVRIIDYLFRTAKINRRMHNKLIVADGAIAVTGGRNISSEYFDASYSFQFTDLDILFFGAAVNKANDVMNQYWNYPLSYPVDQLIKKGTDKELQQLRKNFQILEQKETMVDNIVNEEQKELADEITQNKMAWAYAEFLADTPDKTLGLAKKEQLISHQIAEQMGEAKNEMNLIAAYFVPTKVGAQYISQFPVNGVDVKILTNSFVANDVAMVHAFYQKYRKDLLNKGVKLYEFKPYIERQRRTWYEVVTGNVIPKKGKNKSSLHAKFITIDHNVFIGSFNLDPRSFNLNTEVGLVVHSEELQKTISQMMNQSLPLVAYELRLNPQGEIVWVDHQPDGKIVEFQTDPHTTKFQRFMMYSISYLPIEGLM